MKVLSAILATLILFLTMQPVLTKRGFTAQKGAGRADKCCADKQNAPASEKQQKKDNNCCNDGHCDNSFLTCSHCCFINQDELYFSVVQVFRKPKQAPLLTDKIASAYIPDFWHPPKVFRLEKM